MAQGSNLGLYKGYVDTLTSVLRYLIKINKVMKLVHENKDGNEREIQVIIAETKETGNTYITFASSLFQILMTIKANTL